MGMGFDLAREALRASGVSDADEISSYTRRLENLRQRVLPQLKGIRDPISGARRVFEWLWSEKPGRYESHGRFRLNLVIDAQFDKDSRRVGNCLGLTVLYNCLLQKLDMNPRALYLEHAFDIGPHVLTLLPHQGGTIDVEHVFPDGFGYKGHVKNPDRIVWGDVELVADIYHSAGNESFDRGDFADALACYDRSLQLNPEYAKAHVNRAVLLEEMEKTSSGGMPDDSNKGL